MPKKFDHMLPYNWQLENQSLHTHMVLNLPWNFM